MGEGAWGFGLLSRHTKMVGTCKYHGGRYVLYLGYSNILVLVCVTGMWYIYVDYMLGHTGIVDGLIFTLGGIM